jgi:hypothetical protein
MEQMLSRRWKVHSDVAADTPDDPSRPGTLGSLE